MDCYDDPAWRLAGSTWGEAPLVIESACRRPGWTFGGAVPLAGRLVLHLPKLDAPTVRVFPLMRSLGPDLSASYAAWEAAGDEASFRAWYGPATLIAAGLLAANYAHNPYDLAELFPHDIGEATVTAAAISGALGGRFGAWLASRPGEDDAPGMFDYGQGWFHDGWSLDGPPEVEAPPLVERHRRRPGWTPGAVVTLAEGRGWRLPALDATLVVGAPGLRDEVMRFCPLAAEGMKKLAELPDPGDALGRSRAALDFNRQLVRVAMLLVAENYDLSFAERGRLLPNTDAWVALYRDAEAPIMEAFRGPWAPALVPTIAGSGLDLTIN